MRPVNKTPERIYYHADYDILRRNLISTIGAYCSYCEAPITVDIPVEHKAPKSTKRGNYVVHGHNYQNVNLGFPPFATQWRNLVLSCTQCNSVKGDRPTTEDARNYLAATGGNPATNDWETLFVAGIHSAIFPDSTPQITFTDAQGHQTIFPALPGDETYKLLTYEYTPRSQAYWVQQQLRRNFNAVNQGWATQNHQMVWIIPDTAYINQQSNSALLLSRVKHVIRMCGLNNYHDGDPKMSDRRVFNRTRTFANIGVAATRLASAVQNSGGIFDAQGAFRPAVNIMALAIREAALAQGYFSLWYRTFRTLMKDQNHPIWSHLPQAQIGELFKVLFLTYPQGERIDGASNLIFPGTDLTKLPAW